MASDSHAVLYRIVVDRITGAEGEVAAAGLGRVGFHLVDRGHHVELAVRDREEPRVVEAVAGRVEVLFDSGIRRGADIFKAIALGARCVLLGRPYCFGLAVGGEEGVRIVLRNLLADNADAIVVAAGMDGALPSVVSGLAPVPVIGLPTSIGYGMGGKGVAALLSMLQTCAPGMSVVNIDNGVGAGMTAALIANRIAHAREHQSQ